MGRQPLEVAKMRSFVLENKYMVLLILAIIFIALMFLKKILLEKAVKKELQVGKAITIGDEEVQEDYLEVVSTSYGTLAALADGFGKNQSGRISSTVSVKVIAKNFLEQFYGEKVEYFLKKAFNTTNTEVLKRLADNKGGTSLASAIVIENLLYYGLVGNTMIALYRKGELYKLSEGHTINVLAKKEFYKGSIPKEVALSALNEKKLVHYIGQDNLKEIEISETPISLQTGDIIVLMSKGIYDCIPWIVIEGKIRNNKNFSTLPKEIIKATENSNKQRRNNGSIILIKYM